MPTVYEVLQQFENDKKFDLLKQITSTLAREGFTLQTQAKIIPDAKHLTIGNKRDDVIAMFFNMDAKDLNITFDDLIAATTGKAIPDRFKPLFEALKHVNPSAVEFSKIDKDNFEYYIALGKILKMIAEHKEFLAYMGSLTSLYNKGGTLVALLKTIAENLNYQLTENFKFYHKKYTEMKEVIADVASINACLEKDEKAKISMEHIYNKKHLMQKLKDEIAELKIKTKDLKGNEIDLYCDPDAKTDATRRLDVSKTNLDFANLNFATVEKKINEYESYLNQEQAHITILPENFSAAFSTLKEKINTNLSGMSAQLFEQSKGSLKTLSEKLAKVIDEQQQIKGFFITKEVELKKIQQLLSASRKSIYKQMTDLMDFNAAFEQKQTNFSTLAEALVSPARAITELNSLFNANKNKIQAIRDKDNGFDFIGIFSSANKEKNSQDIHDLDRKNKNIEDRLNKLGIAISDITANFQATKENINALAVMTEEKNKTESQIKVLTALQKEVGDFMLDMNGRYVALKNADQKHQQHEQKANESKEFTEKKVFPVFAEINEQLERYSAQRTSISLWVKLIGDTALTNSKNALATALKNELNALKDMIAAEQDPEMKKLLSLHALELVNAVKNQNDALITARNAEVWINRSSGELGQILVAETLKIHELQQKLEQKEEKSVNQRTRDALDLNTDTRKAYEAHQRDRIAKIKTITLASGSTPTNSPKRK